MLLHHSCKSPGKEYQTTAIVPGPTMFMRPLLRYMTWKHCLLFTAICLSLWNLLDSKATTDWVASKLHFDDNTLWDFFATFHERHQKMTKVTTRSTVYSDILDNANLYQFLQQSTLEDRCSIYFNHLTVQDPQWIVDPHRGLNFNRPAFFTFEQYKQDYINEHSKQAQAAAAEGKQHEKLLSDAQIRERYDRLKQASLTDEQVLHDYMAHMRIFLKCFLSPPGVVKLSEDQSFVRKQRLFLLNRIEFSPREESKKGVLLREKVKCSHVEKKLFPWLTTNYPKFTRWNNEKPEFPGTLQKRLVNTGCFLSDYKKRLNGRGIVMTIHDAHVADASRLIRLLRYLRNSYPIQVVYHSGVSDESIQNLIRAARKDFRGLPPQDIWFVDTRPAIDEKGLDKFSGYTNKIMAAFFNSFAEMLLLDADTVPLQSPEFFFNLKKYVQTGTMFYKDRTLPEYRSDADLMFFKKLLPSVEDSMVFNIAQASDVTLNNHFFNGFNHMMESGLVLVNRKMHFAQPLFMATMDFYTMVSWRIHGDKELFWLALSLSGDENFYFNDNYAAAIGELTPEVERHSDINDVKSFRSKEICSNHPAHINDEDNSTLLWFNSGYRHCGNVMKSKYDIEADFNRKRRYQNIKTLEEFREFFTAPLKIRAAIIPPFNPDRKGLNNIEHEPDIPWATNGYCMGYSHCAYSLIGGYYIEDGKTKSNTMKGVYIEFPPEQTAVFDRIGEIWAAPLEWMQ